MKRVGRTSPNASPLSVRTSDVLVRPSTTPSNEDPPPMTETISPDVDTAAIAHQISRDVGARLRVLREQRQMSLHEVESLSDGAFGPSTIGAYERGERVVSLPRLRRLATLYGVPLEQLLPTTTDQAFAGRTSPINEPLRVDLAMLHQLHGDSFSAMVQFIENIRIRRGDTVASVCTLRGADAIVIAAMLDVPVGQVVARLRALDLSPAA